MHIGGREHRPSGPADLTSRQQYVALKNTTKMKISFLAHLSLGASLNPERANAL